MKVRIGTNPSSQLIYADYPHSQRFFVYYLVVRHHPKRSHPKQAELIIPILNDNLIVLFEKSNYNVSNYNVSKANEQVLNRYIKNILKDLSETVPSLKETAPIKLPMKQKDAMRRDKM